MMSDRRITIAELKEDTGLGHGSIETIIHEHLQINKISARWVPKFQNSDLDENGTDISRES